MNRKVFAKYLVVLTVGASILATGCRFTGDADGRPEVSQGPESFAVAEALEVIDQIRMDIAQGFMLADAAPLDRQDFEDALLELQLALQQLAHAPEDAAALEITKDKIYRFKQAPLYNYDQLQVNNLMTILDELFASTLFEATFDTGFDGFQDIPVVGNVRWANEAERTYLKITAFKKGASETWLVSPRFDLRHATEPLLEIRQAVGYLGDWQELQVLVSADYDGKDPRDATWQEVVIQERPPLSPNWQWRTSEDIDLSAYQNAPFVLAFKYTSTAASQATWELEHVRIKGRGDIQIATWQAVGVAAKPSAGAGGQAPKDGTTANDAPVSNPNAPAKPAGGKGNADGKGSGGASTGADNQDTGGAGNGFVETFTAGLGAFKAYSAAGPKAEWSQKTFKENGYVLISGHKKGANSDWLLSPRFDFSAAKDAHLSFRQVYGYTANEDPLPLRVMVSQDYAGGDPAAATWQEIKPKTYPNKTKDGADYDGKGFTPWVQTEAIPLADYVDGGSHLVVAFHYTSSETQAATWQLDDVKIAVTGKLGQQDIAVPSTGASDGAGGE